VVEAHIDGDGAQRVGALCVMTRRISGKDRISTSKITEFSPPRTWAIRGIDGPIRANVHVSVEPIEDGARSRVTIRLEFTGQGIGKMIVPMAIMQARTEVPESCQKLKKRLENDEKG
jgi:hypothetical protein